MPKRTSAGQLRARISFAKRGDLVDEYGNASPGFGDWETQFTCAARLQPRLGSEPVIAARLTGVQPYTLTVRSTVDTRRIAPDWQAIDARDESRVFNIKAIANVDERNAYLELLVVQGESS